MLTGNQLELLRTIELVCQRCIRAANYFDIASGTHTNAWAFTQNCYGGICIIRWCQVFGSRSEPTHYSHLFDGGSLAGLTKDIVAKKLCAALDMNKIEYHGFWQHVKDARDKFLVHHEFGARNKRKFPDTALLVRTCLSMREVILEIVEGESSSDTKLHGDIRHFVSYYTNRRFLSEINREIGILKKAIPRGK